MFMSCPHCQFLIAYPAQQRALPGKCPRCGQLLDNSAENSVPAADAPAQDNIDFSGYLHPRSAATEQRDASHAPPASAQADVTTFALPPSVGAIADNTVAVEDDSDAFAAVLDAGGEAAAVPATPRFAHSATAPAITSKRSSRVQWLLVALLSCVLVMQIVVADREQLAADPRWRPLVTSLCGVLGCSVPAWHEPDAFTMLSRDVRPVPGVPGLLQVHASFRNDARWAQSWPTLQLSLSDADGRTTGSRAFLPVEYLKGEAARGLLAPGQSAQVAFQVQEPAASTVAYTFDFH